MSAVPPHLRPFGTKWKSPVRDVLSPLTHPPAPPRRESRPAGSSSTSFGNGAAKPANVYTGTACIGIAAMHKSNLVPIFSAESAIDTAKMRRD